MWLNVAYLGIAFLLLLLNAFFVLAEFAIVKVRDTRMQELARKGNRTAALTHEILGKLDAYLSACQLGITIASLGLGWIGEPATTKLIEPVMSALGIRNPDVIHGISVALGFSVITAAHIILGELAPKSVAIRKAEKAALFSARPLHWFYLVFYIPLRAMNLLSNVVLRLLGIHMGATELAHSEEELKLILGTSHERGAFTLSRLLMMENILDFGTLKVEDVMVPWDKVVTLDPAAPWSQNLGKIRTCLHSRYPLAKSPRPDSQVHIKDIALSLAATGAIPDLKAIARPIHTVKADLSLEGLLMHFNQTRTHLALVLEAAGRLQGLVTLEDVLEELIGTIRDEFEPVKDYSLASIVPAEAVILDLKESSKERAVRALAAPLAARQAGLSLDGIVATVMKREALASTGLGEGIAIPHGRVPGLTRPVAAIGRAAGGIEYQALDGKPVDLLFLILTPPHDEGAHVHILEKISQLLSSDYLRERLRQAATPDEVLEIFRISDKSLPA